MTPRRILMTADSVGGVLSYAEDLCRGLARAGVEVLLAVMGGRLDADQRARLARIDGLTIEDSDYALEWMESPWSEVTEAGAWLLELAQRFDPDLVHLNGYAHASLPWRRPVVVVGHSCVGSWFEAVHKAPLPFRYARYHQEVRRGLAAADAVVAPSRYMADALDRHYGPVDGLHVIPNGIWLGDYGAEPCSSGPPIAREPFVLAAGRLWDEAKNVRLLAEVAAALPWPVKVAGESLETTLPEGVEALGRLSRGELADVMRRASIFVHVARYEPFGLAPLEAAASGCALVLSDIPTLRTLWAGCADLVQVADGRALGDVLTSLIDGPVRRAAMAERARGRARAYDARTMTDAYLALYREMGSRHRDCANRSAARADAGPTTRKAV